MYHMQSHTQFMLLHCKCGGSDVVDLMYSGLLDHLLVTSCDRVFYHLWGGSATLLTSSNT